MGDGRDYRGNQNITRSGKTCMKWTLQDPHKHGLLEKYPDAGLGDHNFCRNPDGEQDDDGEIGIWCYTTDPLVPWDYCDPVHEEQVVEEVEEVPVSMETLTGEDLDQSYRGSAHTTRSGRVCQKWST